MSKLTTAIGLMSGTSLDGIDVAILQTDGENTVHRGFSRTYPYDDSQRDMLQEAIRKAAGLSDRTARPGSLAAIEWSLTDWHVIAVEQFMSDFGITESEFDLIGFHGQTILHRPEKHLTIQLGDGPLLSRRLGKPVVYDMRAADIAAGGQGAPLVPAYHRALAASLPERPVAFVNIGGVTNITWIGRDDELIAFDTGPGNALLNDWIQKHVDKPYDPGGEIALAGRISEDLLYAALEDTYFDRPPPKSLDRNAFASLSFDKLSVEDGAATLVAFTASGIRMAADWLPETPHLWIICGGGRRNAAIMSQLRKSDEVIQTAEEISFDGDAMEAEAWAYLAVRSVAKLPLSYPRTTGVFEATTGGVLARP